MRLSRVGTLTCSLLWTTAAALPATEVAVLKSADVAPWRPTLDAMHRVAAAHALNEYDLRNDSAQAERVIGELRGKAAILVAMGPLAAQAARELAPETPLVYCMIQDPGKAGLLGVPNVSGVAFTLPVRNQLAAFRFVNPRAVRIGVIYSEANTASLVEEAQKSATVVRLRLVTRPVASEREVPAALRQLLNGPQAVDALWFPPDPILLGEESRRYILAETLKAGKPVYSFSPALVAEGALVSNGPDPGSIGEEVGELVNRIAAGERGKSELLIPRAELVINQKIAERLRIEIPADALRAAGRVF
jgi:putative ABC transport system substrate-binding protein